MLGIGLPLGRWSHHSLVSLYALRRCDATFLLRHSHGAVTVKHHALCNDQPSSADVAIKPRWGYELNSFRACNVALNATMDDHDLAVDLGPDLSSFSNGELSVTLNLPVHTAIDSGGALERQLTCYPASFMKRCH